MLDAWLTSLAASLTEFSLDTLQVMPYSTLFILLISTVMNLVVSLVNRMATNIEEYREWTTKSTLLRRDMMKAMQSGNKRLVEKLQKDQQESMKIQTKMSMQRLKLTLYFMIPFFAIWVILQSFYGNNIVAIMPFDLPYIGTRLDLFWWYFICSMLCNVLIQRLLGLTFEI
jgi:uncharacterized membrane protein (DUF106 family)